MYAGRVGDPAPRSGRRAAVLLLAAIAGAILPWGALAYYVSIQDPYPPACRGGSSGTLSLKGQVLYAQASALFLANADLSVQRRLADYGPAPAAPSPSASPTTTPAAPTPTASASPSASESASPSPVATPAPPTTEVLAASISPDSKTVAFLVADPPDKPGTASLRVVSVADANAAPVEVWSDAGYQPRTGLTAAVAWLPGNLALVEVPHRVGKGPPTRLVVVVSTQPPGQMLEAAAEAQFRESLAATWPETKGIDLVIREPLVDGAVRGASGAVAGIQDRTVDSFLAHAVMHQVVVGRVRSSSVRPICSTRTPLEPLAFSPDEKLLAVFQSGSTYSLDVSGTGWATQILDGRLLDWKAAPKA